MDAFLIFFVSILCQILSLAIFIRVLLSWLPIQNLGPLRPVVDLLYAITDPVLVPLRRIIPPIGMIDITPVVAIILLEIIQSLVVAL